jgi:bifunctional enzyme CysN/CysC
MVIDAAHGVEENTRRHGYYLSMLGIKQVAVLVNKMDLIDYDRDKYEKICAEYTAFLREIGIEPSTFVPVSAQVGDNLAQLSDRTPWYKGLTVLQVLDSFENIQPSHRLPFRMCVQGVYKFTAGGDTRRIIAGTVDSGTLRVGDEVVFYPSGKRTKVKGFEAFNATPPEEVQADEAVGFTMEEEIYVRRGEITCRADETAPKVAVRVRANLFWLGKKPLEAGRGYFFKCGTQKLPMKLVKVERVVNASNLDCETDRQWVGKNEVAVCTFRLDAPAAFDTTDQLAATSRFVIVDEYEQAGGGIIVEALTDEDYDLRNIRSAAGAAPAAARRALTGRRGLVVWMCGLSGAGKSTIAAAAERQLLSEGIPAFTLDGDVLRRGLCADLGFTDEDREENQRRAAEVAVLLKSAGNIVLVSTISPLSRHRAKAREIVGADFMEVYVKASLDTCRERDPKKLYEKQEKDGIAHFTGVDSAFEIPAEPDLTLDTEGCSAEECVEALLSAIHQQL